MIATEFEKVRQELLDHAEGVQTAKRPGYTVGDADILKNFKSVAARVGITPGQVLAVYMLKHVDAVTAILCRPDLPVSEAPIGRFGDLINYSQLGFALSVEAEREALRDVVDQHQTHQQETRTYGLVGDVCGCADCRRGDHTLGQWVSAAVPDATGSGD